MWDFIKENWMSLIALIISIIGFFKDNIKDIIQHLKIKKETKSAKITISYINEKLIISNKGQANARNVKILVDDVEIEHSSVFAAFARNMNFSLLSPNNSIGIKSIINMGTKCSFNIKVLWEDDNSKNNKTEDIINVF